MLAEYATFAVAAILIVAMVLEIRTGRIPNWLTALPLVVFAGLLFVADDRNPLYSQLGLAAGVFVFGLLMFGIGGMGAGAVKLMAGTALFIPFVSTPIPAPISIDTTNSSAPPGLQPCGL